MSSTGNKKGFFVSATRRCRFLPTNSLATFLSKASHNIAGGAGQAGETDRGVGEREGGAGVAPAGERRSDQGDHFIMSQQSFEDV